MNFYQHSGKVGYSPIFLLAAGIPLMVVLSCIYAYITDYNPIAGYLTFLILAGYALANGYLISTLARYGKCRSKTLLIAAGVVGGLISVYFSWLFFIYVLSHRAGYDDVGILDILVNPSEMWEAIKSINESGWFTIKGSTPSGIVLWIFWGIEALSIVVGAVFMTAFSIDDEMFCEKCNAWCNVAETKYLKTPEKFTNSKARNINPTMLADLETGDLAARPIIKSELLKCGSCINYSGWRYKLISSEADKKGDEKDKLESIPGIVMALG